MIKNNKGVTLVELLIVIVVMGIIAAFAIPAVGTIVGNTRMDAIRADAIAVENAANLYCAQTACTTDETLTWADVKSYVEGIDPTYYEFDLISSATDGAGDAEVATKSAAGWTVTLEAYTVGDYEFLSAIPSQSTRSNVTVKPEQ